MDPSVCGMLTCNVLCSLSCWTSVYVFLQVVRAINKDGTEEERTIPYTLVAPAILACPPDDETGWQAFGDQNPMSTIEGQRVLYCKDGLRVDPQKYATGKRHSL
jgi:hypothetical protein